MLTPMTSFRAVSPSRINPGNRPLTFGQDKTIFTTVAELQNISVRCLGRLSDIQSPEALTAAAGDAGIANPGFALNLKSTDESLPGRQLYKPYVFDANMLPRVQQWIKDDRKSPNRSVLTEPQVYLFDASQYGINDNLHVEGNIV